MQCFIYRSLKKKGLYVYLPEENDFSKIPVDVLNMIGDLELALEIEIDKERKLAKENAADVLSNIKKNGFHLQMPADIEHLLTAISKKLNQAQ
jgi:uncharacterized protein YcgL (UPF0745 family)